MSDPDWHDVTATTAAELDEVATQIHDCPFEADDVVFDAPGRALTVPFRRFGFDAERRIGSSAIRVDYEFPWRRSFLRVHNATAHRVDDRAGIGTYGLLDVQCDADRSAVRIVSVPEHEIETDVERLEVAVEHTDQVLGTGRRSSWLGRVYKYDKSVRPQ